MARSATSRTIESYRDGLSRILQGDLDFHTNNGNVGAHNFHSFPAKFPPQLPREFILGLTSPGDVVLDPMVGSGTTAVEAIANGRVGIGFDIDPLALLMTSVKTAVLNVDELREMGARIVGNARRAVEDDLPRLMRELETRFPEKTKAFIDFWFSVDVQIELLALVREIDNISDPSVKAFFELCFSGTIITKSGGVSLAFDLGHTRPHKAKVVVNTKGRVLAGEELMKGKDPPRLMVKILRSAIDEFEKRLRNNLKSISEVKYAHRADIRYGNSDSLPLDNASVDLIVTSPPYASNAIDYMRAHKFSLVWMGRYIEELEQLRKRYIGGELTTNFQFEDLPAAAFSIVSRVSSRDEKKGRVLSRYFSEMTRSLREMYRVLKPGTAAIVVVGSSVMRGVDTETGVCLAAIGEACGFEVAGINIRNLDRNRRMLPAGADLNLESQIQQRMHTESVIGFYKREEVL